jgi:DDRGK domain-containing protein 1
MIEDIASTFKLASKDCISRLEQLIEQGRLQGITDDRGKFIYITD